MKQIFFNTLILLLLGLPAITFAQNATQSFEKEYEWDSANESKTVEIQVKKGADELSIEFRGKISEGAFYMTAYDPEGNKAAGFSLVCSGDSGVHVETTGGGNASTYHTGSGSNNQVRVESTGSSNTTVVTQSDGKSKVKRKSKHKDKGNYSMTSTNSDSKGAKGVMVKRLSDPMPGTWKFVMEVEEATGTMKAEIDQD